MFHHFTRNCASVLAHQVMCSLIITETGRHRCGFDFILRMPLYVPALLECTNNRYALLDTFYLRATRFVYKRLTVLLSSCLLAGIAGFARSHDRACTFGFPLAWLRARTLHPSGESSFMRTGHMARAWQRECFRDQEVKHNRSHAHEKFASMFPFVESRAAAAQQKAGHL